MRFHLYAFVLLHITLQISSQQPKEQEQKISLDQYSGNGSFTFRLNLTDGNIVINVTNQLEGGFFVIQAHSLLSNVTLSKTRSLVLGSYVVGADIGMVEEALKPNTSYLYYVKPSNATDIQVLISVILYRNEDPIPGGCNMVYNTKIAPYQLLSYDDYMVQVDAAPALGLSCDTFHPQLDMYQFYLTEGNLDTVEYFDSIEKLMTVDGIKRYAKKVTDSLNEKSLRRYYSAYPGVGSLYAIIATFGNSSSAYVPIATYACNVNNWNESCVGPVSVIWKILFALILFMGIFMCVFGNRFFVTILFIFGFIFGSFISYVTLPWEGNATAGYGIGMSILMGIIYGATWMFFWFRFGMPIVSVIVPIFFTGYVVACIVFYAGIDDLPILDSEPIYWSVFLSIILLTMVILLLFTLYGNIVPCSVIGASAIIITIDHYVGGALHYAIFNNMRRLTVKHFNLAILNPPYQYKDIILSCTWCLLVIVSIVIQGKQQIGKPPFPPRNRRMNFERTPLLINRRR